jgi:hypothetical protein
MPLITTILIIVILIIAILMIFRFKKIKYKLLFLFLIALILFSIFTFNSAFNGKGFSINNISDFGKIIKIYFSWLGNAFNNLKTISGQAVKMDWRGNITS